MLVARLALLLIAAGAVEAQAPTDSTISVALDFGADRFVSAQSRGTAALIYKLSTNPQSPPLVIGIPKDIRIVTVLK